ncbi:MAG: phosphotransferase [Planctomycetales bacterium]|nr:phosphotransferase [Planctomycetales bacterium]
MDRVHSILHRFGLSEQVRSLIPLQNAGGFSGASLWQVQTRERGAFALRQWPAEHPSRERLEFIHQVQTHLLESVGSIIPRLVKSMDGKTFVEERGRFWELSAWVAGEPSFHFAPNDAKLISAMETLAKIHNAAAELRCLCKQDVSPGLLLRRNLADRWTRDAILKLASSIDESYPELTQVCRRILDHAFHLTDACRDILAQVGDGSLQLIPCLKDIWHDHVLFTNDAVSGIVDFGAMQVDTPTGDIARLIGSLVEDNQCHWQLALEKYAWMRPLSLDELQFVHAFDIANVTYSGINWIQWIYVDRRQFSEMSAIARRLETIVKRQNYLRKKLGC